MVVILWWWLRLLSVRWRKRRGKLRVIRRWRRWVLRRRRRW